jgi:pimeloyl-ACP methyl ester carboxylesterase
VHGAACAGPGAREETVRFGSEGATLVGTLALPPAARHPVPAVVLLHGSERGRRDSPLFRLLRERLCALGLAVLSYDRRGVGESGGEYVETPDLRVPARDALSALRFLAQRSEVDRARIGLLGISQGGWVAPLAATLAPGVAFVVALSEPGVSPLAQSSCQRAAELIEQGLATAAADSATALRTLLCRYWHGDASRAAAESAWADARGSAWLGRAAATDELFSRIGHLPAVPPPARMPQDFIRALDEHFFYDPIPVAETLRVPVLHLFGAADRHLPVAESVEAFRSAYRRSGNRDATVRVIPGAGHALQRVSGAAECLRCPPAPWEPAAGWPDTLAAWLGTHQLR